MLEKTQPLAIFMEGSLGQLDGKMGYGVLRYSENPVVCVIDSIQAGLNVSDVIDVGRDCPVVSNVEQAYELGARVLVLGIAPSGGRVPADWFPAIDKALELEMSLVNGLHDFLAPRYKGRLKQHQFIWDVRDMGDKVPGMAQGRAGQLSNRRVLMVGTDMAIGKMTVGLELHRQLRRDKIDAGFIATGQIGLTIKSFGVPLDAVKVDHSCGWMEDLNLQLAHHPVVIIEGQGSLLHPGSSATLSLMRGSCPTDLVLCHKAGMTHLDTSSVLVPSLRKVIELNELVASAAGALTSAKTIGVALNTSHLDESSALYEISKTEDEVGLPVTDVVRFGAGTLSSRLH